MDSIIFKNTYKNITVTIFILITLPFLLIAKPVRVDEILTEKKSFKLYVTTSYININRKDSTLAPLQYQTQNGDFVTIPTYLGDSRSNQDYLGYALSLRYGVNRDIEIFYSVNLYILIKTMIMQIFFKVYEKLSIF